MRKVSITAALLAVLAVHAQAQTRDAETPRRERAPLTVPDDLEPAVDVGRTRLAVAERPAPPPSAPPVAGAAPSAPPAAASTRDSRPSEPGRSEQQGATTAVARDPAAAEPSPARTPNARALDSIDLGTTSITGNQELPKVLYIVPWKKSDLGDLVGRPVNTLLDEVLTPVDPEVFERHLNYYETLYGKKREQE